MHARRATVLESLGRVAEAEEARSLAAALCRASGLDPALLAWLGEEPSGTRH